LVWSRFLFWPSFYPYLHHFSIFCLFFYPKMETPHSLKMSKIFCHTHSITSKTTVIFIHLLTEI
jgi:hypothetical protein